MNNSQENLSEYSSPKKLKGNNKGNNDDIKLVNASYDSNRSNLFGLNKSHDTSKNNLPIFNKSRMDDDTMNFEFDEEKNKSYRN